MYDCFVSNIECYVVTKCLFGEKHGRIGKMVAKTICQLQRKNCVECHIPVARRKLSSYDEIWSQKDN